MLKFTRKKIKKGSLLTMPKTKSAIKRVKTAEKAHLRNISYKSKIKTNIKKLNTALAEKNENNIANYFKESISSLDKAASKGILPLGTAARKKSRLTKRLNTLTKAVPLTEIKETAKSEEKSL